jgi:hypothetical protein
VAKLMPLNPGFDREKARAAVQELRKLANAINAPKLGWEEIKKMRDEGRR